MSRPTVCTRDLYQAASVRFLSLSLRMFCAAFRALSEPNTEVFGLLVALTTVTASLTGWEEPVDNNEFLSIPVGFAGKLSADFTPRDVSDMECELVAPHHVLPRLRVLDKG